MQAVAERAALYAASMRARGTRRLLARAACPHARRAEAAWARCAHLAVTMAM
eukprot:NODE_13748_length_240_cov_1.178378.p4 GENE.NODE_13748_length_240_cov_1.178378~~NODE_13748_length_240_cov_1.178378.p4  ORF type:complete len:52 (-),score=8.65 NODE_13748_length_240_cov_1.178378:15-170(-)